jgi:hypothetical protein
METEPGADARPEGVDILIPPGRCGLGPVGRASALLCARHRQSGRARPETVDLRCWIFTPAWAGWNRHSSQNLWLNSVFFT